VLLSKDGTIGRVAIFNEDEPIAALSSICIMRTRPSVNSNYLAQALISGDFAKQINNATSGSALRRLVLREIEKLEISIPPLPEQRRIAEILDTLDEAILKTEKVIAKLQKMKQGLLHDLLARGIDENGELRDPERHPENFKDSPLGRIPKGWEVESISALFEVRSGATPARSESRFFDGEVPWVKTLDLNERIINSTAETITETAVSVTACSILPPGTVLVAMYGGWQQIGRTSFLGLYATTNQAISSLLPTPRMNPQFTVYCLQHLRRAWKRVAASTRKDPNITKDDIQHFLLLVPPLWEQMLIIQRLDIAYGRIHQEEAEITKLRSLKQGLMDDLLTGRVRVPVESEAAAA
jgi:type I restriction enzyme S subunit